MNNNNVIWESTDTEIACLCELHFVITVGTESMSALKYERWIA